MTAGETTSVATWDLSTCLRCSMQVTAHYLVARFELWALVDQPDRIGQGETTLDGHRATLLLGYSGVKFTSTAGFLDVA